MSDTVAKSQGIFQNPIMLFRTGNKIEGKLVFPSGTQHTITLMEEKPGKAQRLREWALGTFAYTTLTHGPLAGKWVRLDKRDLPKSEKKLIDQAFKTLKKALPIIVDKESEVVPVDLENTESFFREVSLDHSSKGDTIPFFDDRRIVANNDKQRTENNKHVESLQSLQQYSFTRELETQKSSPQSTFKGRNSEQSDCLDHFIDSVSEDSSQNSSYETSSSRSSCENIPSGEPVEIVFQGTPLDSAEICNLPITNALAQQALVDGTAGVLVSLRGRPFRLDFQMKIDGKLYATLSEPTIPQHELDELVYSKKFSKNDVQELSALFNKYLYNLYNLAIQQFVKKEAGVIKDDLYVQVHIKDDGSITVGFAKKFKLGTFKEPQMITQIGFAKKQYVEAPLQQRNLAFIDIIEKERNALDTFQHPHIAEKRKNMDKEIPIIDSKTGKISSFFLTGFKSPFYAHGSASCLTKTSFPDNAGVLLRTKVIKDIAAGLAYLHSTGHVDGDLKPENIFLTEDDRAVIGDVSPVKIGDTLKVVSKAFIDPKTMVDFLTKKAGNASKANDVWALGVSLLEFMYGGKNNLFSKPEMYYDGSEGATIAIFVQLERLFSKNRQYDDINELLRKIFTYKQDSRITIEEVIIELDKIIKKRSP